jgi:hypothetical protein
MLIDVGDLNNEKIKNNINIESGEIEKLEEIKNELLEIKRLMDEKDDIEKFKDQLTTEGSMMLGIGFSAAVTLITLPGMARYFDGLLFLEASMFLLIISSIFQIELRQTVNEKNFNDLKQCFKFGFKGAKKQIEVAGNNQYFLIHRLSLYISCVCMSYGIFLTVAKHYAGG